MWEIEAILEAVGRPLSEREIGIAMRLQRNPWSPRLEPERYASWKPVDPRAWRMPDRPVPASYVSFLQWSDGGHFRNGDRCFQMCGTGLRQMALDCLLPEFMPGALPFAFNGGGVMYLFDMRRPADAGEYPIVCARAGSFSWKPGCLARVADGFVEACRGRTNVEIALTAALRQALAEQR